MRGRLNVVRRAPALPEAMVPVAVLAGSLFLALFVVHVSFVYALAAATASAAALGLRLGFSLPELGRMAAAGIRPTIYILVFFMLIGALMGIWHLSGTIPSMIYYGIQAVHPSSFYLSAFLVTGAVSMLLGTSLGTIGTLGVPLMGIAGGLGMSLPATAGAVISGAFLGDRSSPLSSSANLTAAVTDTSLYHNLRHMAVTIAPPLAASAGGFYFLGLGAGAAGGGDYRPVLALLEENFRLGVPVLLPVFLVLALALGRTDPRKVLLAGSAAGLLVALFYQHCGLTAAARAVLLGYSGPPGLGQLGRLRGGGLAGFFEMDLVIVVAAALTGLLEGTGVIALLLEKAQGYIRGQGGLVSATVLTSIAVAAVTGNQTMAIIIPGRIMLPLYRKFMLAPETLARALADSGVMVVPLIPWNVAAIFSSSALGVPPADYIPCALLCWLTPPAAVILGYVFARKPA
ncbi:MAG: sodium:proton antiporter [Peptococcaceae bacterium]|nr:sodium:proton antiporter [Peptococcaceae bacterium]